MAEVICNTQLFLSGMIKREEWKRDSYFHREDGPACISYFETGVISYQAWYWYGQQHREDGPAWLEYYPNGSVKCQGWFIRDRLHNEDEPAVIKYYPDGTIKYQVWYYRGRATHKVVVASEPAWEDLVKPASAGTENKRSVHTSVSHDIEE